MALSKKTEEKYTKEQLKEFKRLARLTPELEETEEKELRIKLEEVIIKELSNAWKEEFQELAKFEWEKLIDEIKGVKQKREFKKLIEPGWKKVYEKISNEYKETFEQLSRSEFKWKIFSEAMDSEKYRGELMRTAKLEWGKVLEEQNMGYQDLGKLDQIKWKKTFDRLVLKEYKKELKELDKFLAKIPKLVPIPVSKGDLVEILDGPFKGEKARVAEIYPTKDEITVELIEAAVAIPVIVKGYNLRILKNQ